MKIELYDLPATLYTPDNQVWMWDAEERLGLYRSGKNRFERWTLAEIINFHGEVSTEPYPPLFEVGYRIDNEQVAVELPVGSVILDRNNVPFQKANQREWDKAGVERLSLNSELNFPATVLWLPEGAGA